MANIKNLRTTKMLTKSHQIAGHDVRLIDGESHRECVSLPFEGSDNIIDIFALEWPLKRAKAESAHCLLPSSDIEGVFQLSFQLSELCFTATESITQAL